jgi:hypothetical protein
MRIHLFGGRNRETGQQPSTLHLLDPITGQERDRMPLPYAFSYESGGRVFVFSDRLWAYGPGRQG